MFIHENAFEYIVWEMAAIFSRGRRVKTLRAMWFPIHIFYSYELGLLEKCI